MSNNIRRINFFGSPGVGKSTTSSFIFYNLKKKNFKVEFLTEYIKMWTYIPIKPKSFDTFYCFSKQLHKEDIVLRSDEKIITVSDSPLFLNCFYAQYNNNPGYNGMMEIAKEMEEKYPSFNILKIKETDKIYSETGRYHSEEESKEIGYYLNNFLFNNDIEVFKESSNELILEKIFEVLK